MEPDAFGKAWRAQDVQQVNVDVELLLSLVKRNGREFQSMIFRRDALEIGTALVLTGFFVNLGVARKSWPWFVMAAACLFVAAFMVLDRYRQNRKSASPAETLTAWLENSRSNVEHQIWLLRNVFWWYLLPPLIGMMAVFGHALWLAPGINSFVTLAPFLGGLAIVSIVFYGVYLLNQRAVRTELRPRLEELDSLAESLARDED